MWQKTGNVTVSIVLVAIYLIVFGLKSIGRYLGEDIIILKDVDKTSVITPPRKLMNINKISLYILFLSHYCGSNKSVGSKCRRLEV